MITQSKRAALAGLALSSAFWGNPVAAGGALADFNPEGTQPAQGATSTDRVIIKYRNAGSAQANASAMLQELGFAQLVTLSPMRQLATGAQLYRMELSTGMDADAVVAALNQSAEVFYAEQDRVLVRQFVPNDPLYADQWHYYEPIGGLNLPSAWDVASGTGAVAAVLDTGYRPHADLVANILPGYDFISDPVVANDGDARDADATDPGDWTCVNRRCNFIYVSSWHGTHVSGTIAAVTHNGTGVAGVAFGAKVLPGRVLGSGGGYTSDIADAIVWASGGSVSGVSDTANPADVINMSLGGGGACDNTSQEAIDIARANGAAVVVSAGNSDADAANQSPASCDGVVTVAATNRAGARASYSNYGAVVDVSAPGGDMGSSEADGVLSTLNDGVQDPGNDSYAYYQGTSMAAPHVTGVVALMRSVNASLTPDQIECVLKATTRTFPVPPDQPIGTGIVDAHAAVVAAQGGQVLSDCGGGGAPDTTPDPFSFTDVNNVALNSVQTSNTITVNGTDADAAISVLGGEYALGCNGSFTTAAGMIAPGGSVCVRHTASATPGTTVTTTLSIGGVSDGFSSTTVSGGSDATPDPFHFDDVVKAKAGVTYESNAVTVTGTDTGAPISISTNPSSVTAQYAINGGVYTAAPGTVQPGASVRLKVTFPSGSGSGGTGVKEINVTVNIGGVSDVWRLTVRSQ